MDQHGVFHATCYTLHVLHIDYGNKLQLSNHVSKYHGGSSCVTETLFRKIDSRSSVRHGCSVRLVCEESKSLT